MPKILLAGNDFRLLGTRAAVLGKTGASVVCCSAAEALAIVDKEMFDLVVLCHSLTGEDVMGIVDGVHHHWPKTRILQVVPKVVGDKLYDESEFVATSSSEPAHLVRSTMALLRTLPNHRVEDGPSRVPVTHR